MKNKALFLDRDGVINVDKNYVHRIEDFEFMEGIFEVTQHFQDKGYLIIVVTNQAGIGKGYYTEEQFHILNNWMVAEFARRGIEITKVYYCPYHIDGIGEYQKDSFDRKPNPGMLIRAALDHDIDLPQSILVGDKLSDIDAGFNAGIRNNILLSEDCEVSLEFGRIIKLNELIVNE